MADSPYRIAISGSVLKFQESGKIKQLKNRWWKRGDKSACRVIIISPLYYFRLIFGKVYKRIRLDIKGSNYYFVWGLLLTFIHDLPLMLSSNFHKTG